MISAWWLLLIFPAAWMGFLLAALMASARDEQERHKGGD